MNQLPVELQLQILQYLDNPRIPLVYGLGYKLKDMAALACTCRKLRVLVQSWRDLLVRRASAALLQVVERSRTVYSTSRSSHILSQESCSFRELSLFARYRLLFPAVTIYTDIRCHYLVTTTGSLQSGSKGGKDWHYCELEDRVFWRDSKARPPHWWAHVESGYLAGNNQLFIDQTTLQPLCHDKFKVCRPAINWVQLPLNLNLSESDWKMLHHWYMDMYGRNIFLVLQWGSQLRSHNVELLRCSRFERVEHCEHPPQRRQERWQDRQLQKLDCLLARVGQKLRHDIKQANVASRRQAVLRKLRNLEQLAP
jgi:hypothetical protein